VDHGTIFVAEARDIGLKCGFHDQRADHLYLDQLLHWVSQSSLEAAVLFAFKALSLFNPSVCTVTSVRAFLLLGHDGKGTGQISIGAAKRSMNRHPKERLGAFLREE
jgi:hypothetical protein